MPMPTGTETACSQPRTCWYLCGKAHRLRARHRVGRYPRPVACDGPRPEVASPATEAAPPRQISLAAATRHEISSVGRTSNR
jgi:hypothetical protein